MEAPASLDTDDNTKPTRLPIGCWSPPPPSQQQNPKDPLHDGIVTTHHVGPNGSMSKQNKLNFSIGDQLTRGDVLLVMVSQIWLKEVDSEILQLGTQIMTRFYVEHGVRVLIMVKSNEMDLAPLCKHARRTLQLHTHGMKVHQPRVHIPSTALRMHLLNRPDDVNAVILLRDGRVTSTCITDDKGHNFAGAYRHIQQ